jgi:hypothetical protein
MLSAWARLQQAFPDGVCNWSKPPVGFKHSKPWLTFAGLLLGIVVGFYELIKVTRPQ